MPRVHHVILLILETACIDRGIFNCTLTPSLLCRRSFEMLFVPALRSVVKASPVARRSYVELSRLAAARSTPYSRSSRSITCSHRIAAKRTIPPSRRHYSDVKTPETTDAQKSVSAFINSCKFPFFSLPSEPVRTRLTLITSRLPTLNTYSDESRRGR